MQALPLLVSVYELLLFFLVLAAIMATVLFLVRNRIGSLLSWKLLPSCDAFVVWRLLP